MDQLIHLQNNKKNLDFRWCALRLIREFFYEKNFVEVETPLLLRFPGQEPYLSPMKVLFQNEKGDPYTGLLHTSPEYAMKKMLAIGYEKIFSLGKVFRGGESFGGTHNPEFTMIEWYRAHERFELLMDDVENLFSFLEEHLHIQKKTLFERIHMREVWKKYANLNLDDLLETENLRKVCEKKGYSVQKDEPYEDLFYRIFLNEIEPQFSKEKNHSGIILHHYPAQMAALSSLSKTEIGYAERFEVYVGGTEIANAFQELTDAVEQKKRLLEERDVRIKNNREVFDIDEEFVEAVQKMPLSSGIALGVDRLILHLLSCSLESASSCKNLDSVIALPASKLF